MSNASPRPARRQGNRRPLVVTIVVLVVLLIVFFAFASVYSDVLWYQQLGFLNVLTTQWFAAAGFFIAGFIAMAVPVWLSIEIAYRRRPVYARLNSQLDRYQDVIEPLRKLLTWGVPALLGIFAGLSTATRWQMALLWFNSTPTGEKDPQFNLDISFYLFDLPFYRAVVALFSAIVLLSAIAALITNYVYGSIAVARRELRIAKAARIQLAIIGAIYILIQAVSIWLDQYATMTSAKGLITGASYTDVNATIPGLQILSLIAILVSLLFIVTAFTGRWRLPLVGTAMLVISGLILTMGYPWIMQRFIVDPSERSLEEPYIARNIDLTRQAYGVDEIDATPYNATTDATPGALRSDAETTASIRIIDPALVSASFAQLEQFKQYYSFPQELDVDRYTIDGKSQDSVVSVRELNQAGVGSNQSWYNNTLVYTHGYGLVAAYGTERSSDGQPVFLEAGIPSSGELGEFEPRIYFGENSPLYSIIGGTSSTKPVELDYPASGSENEQVYNTFQGEAGPKLENIFNRLVYALKFQSEEILLSDAVTNDSQIIYDRNPLQRVQKAAPYLTLDSDPYPTVVDGRVVWVVDGYTTSANYPYSKMESLSSVISDQAQSANAFVMDNVNYIRNSVKATVDAYDGSVTLYAWDENDAVLKTWQKIYPSNLQPLSKMSGELMSHVRYPTDLFKAQRSILGQYHVTDAGSFYSGDDAWVTPNDPTATSDATKYQSPYYLTMKVPGAEAPAYSIYSTFIPKASGTSSRNVLTGYLVADADAGSENGKKADGYGKLRLLTLPKVVTVPGPGQVQNNFNADPDVSKELNLLSQGSTNVLKGNLLTLPVGGGLLYVQPVYVQSTGNTSYPLLKKILVAFGDKIAFEDTLPLALDALFGGNAGVDDPTNGGAVAPEPDPAADNGGNAPTTNETLNQALQAAKAALADREAARIAGDWAAYGAADAALTEALTRALAASAQ
ncbi:uncharacterized membrane protein (UPF0182 family) [Aurantimicrobium minutum]|uniref:UPF0182 family membrane protein n=1 Tax=Aurantimicrobium minutum TaxID=708131 RepID=UPI002473A2DA|nr:UPF0182 family protein [Aurantimicrobium minutum]MDH6533231.1 uncharacterized membrane protein (UPF0182 family) [Aurantimicrobium minutum]